MCEKVCNNRTFLINGEAVCNRAGFCPFQKNVQPVNFTIQKIDNSFLAPKCTNPEFCGITPHFTLSPP